MAKRTYELIRMQSTESSYFYVTKKTTKGVKASNKLKLRKYDPNMNKHVWFEQKRMHPHKNN